MSIEHKLDLILQRLEIIESNLGIKSKSLFDNPLTNSDSRRCCKTYGLHPAKD